MSQELWMLPSVTLFLRSVWLSKMYSWSHKLLWYQWPCQFNVKFQLPNYILSNCLNYQKNHFFQKLSKITKLVKKIIFVENLCKNDQKLSNSYQSFMAGHMFLSMFCLMFWSQKCQSHSVTWSPIELSSDSDSDKWLNKSTF